MGVPPARRSSAKVAAWQLVLLSLLFTFILVGFAAFGIWRWRVAVRERHDAAERAEQARKAVPFLDVAVASLPSGSVVEGPEGIDADGYPKQFVNQAALRSLLHYEKYAELTRTIEELQTAFERDPRKEYWIHDAIDAFGSAENELDPKLGAWIAATPTSFAPYLARAAHFAAIAFFERGSKWVKDTPTSSLVAMRRYLALAEQDTARAMALHAKLLPVLRLQIQMRAATSDSDGSSEIATATTICPSCFIVRTTYMRYAEPRWGGSYEKMDRYANAVATGDNPRLRLLRGFADIDRARVAASDKKYDEALVFADRACAVGEYWYFLYERAHLRRRREEYDRALADIERAITLRPHVEAVLFERAAIHDARKEWELAGLDLLEGLRIDPTDDARERVGRVVQGLNYIGDQHAKAGRRDDALRVLNLAIELSPMHRESHQRHNAVLMGTLGPDASAGGTDIATLEERARAAPDDFRAQQALDYALARQGKYARVVEIWNAYLSRHPEDGHAYFERGGALYHLGRRAEAQADATKACELGVNEGCRQAKRSAGR